MALPTCRTGCALDEFTSMPAHFREEVDGFEEPTLGRIQESHAGGRRGLERFCEMSAILG